MSYANGRFGGLTESQEGKHFLITGGAGFIGSHLVERLLARGDSVIVIDDISTGSLENLRAVSRHPKLRVIQSKVSACAELGRLVAGAKGIYHLAAAVGVDLVVKSPLHTLQTNLHETEVILKIAAARRVPLLLTSSSEVYGKSEKAEFTETEDLLIGPPNQSRWGYACSKLVDEFLALAYGREQGLPVVVTRLFNTVGPRQTGRYGMVLPRFIGAAQGGEPLQVFGDGLQSRCFCLVSDTVEALMRLHDCAAPEGEVFNIGGSEEITILDLAKLVIEVLGSKSEVAMLPYAEAYAPGFDDMRRRKPNVDKLAAATNFRPKTSLREIILETVGSAARPASG
jgi:UDP-glucose 4-epimerase